MVDIVNTVMIDQTLIENSIYFLKESLANRHRVSDELYQLQNVFTTEALDKLYTYIRNESDKPWQLETKPNYESLVQPRKKIAWHAESIIEELHETISALTPALSELVCESLQFHGMVLWEDLEGYEISWHTDNPILMATMQIYVAGSSNNPGTEFELIDGTAHTCEFIPNTGYLINQTKHRLKHRTTGKVPCSAQRYSVFGMWK